MIFHNTHDFEIPFPTSVALGCFDGVHIGHEAVIRMAVDIAGSNDLRSAVWCFEAPPKNFFSPNSAPVITSASEKAELISRLGVDVCVCVPFDTSISSLSPEEFFERILVKKMNARQIVCGSNYTFGNKGSGNTELLAKLCEKHNIGFNALSHVYAGDIPVSASAIREALARGDLATASALLGRHYSISGRVIDGNHLGRTLGFPTANIALKDGCVVPKNGVYLTRAIFDSKAYYGITNIGRHPTVSPNLLLAETNLFDFSGDIYGKELKLELLEFLRPEQKYPSLAELTAQVESDIEKAKTTVMKKYSK